MCTVLALPHMGCVFPLVFSMFIVCIFLPGAVWDVEFSGTHHQPWMSPLGPGLHAAATRAVVRRGDRWQPRRRVRCARALSPRMYLWVTYRINCIFTTHIRRHSSHVTHRYSYSSQGMGLAN